MPGLLFSNILEEAEDIPPQKVVEDGNGEAVLVPEWSRWNADAEMHLFEIALGFEMDGRLRCGAPSLSAGPVGLMCRTLVHQLQHLVVA